MGFNGKSLILIGATLFIFQLANFISDLEDNVPLFYRQVGQNLSQWKKPAPKIKETSENVDVEAISKEAEDF